MSYGVRTPGRRLRSRASGEGHDASRFAAAEPEAAPIVVPDRHRPRGAGASTRRGRFTRAPRRRLRVAMLAPPWIPVPPRATAAIEAVVARSPRRSSPRPRRDAVLRRRARASHGARRDAARAVAPGRDRARAATRPTTSPAPSPRSTRARGGGAVRRRPRPLGFTRAGDGRPPRRRPLVHTLHGPFDARARPRSTRRHGAQGRARRDQRAPSSRRRRPGCAATASSPTRSTSRPGRCERDKDDYLLWIGRMTADKGPHRAIAAARAAGVPLVLAGPVQPGQEAFFDARGRAAHRRRPRRASSARSAARASARSSPRARRC